MTARLLTRVRLAEHGGSGRMNVLIDVQDIRPGQIISLKDHDGWWLVTEVFETLMAEKIKSNRTWSNNI